MYEGVMREKAYRLPNFTQRSAFEFLGPYLREDPLQLYHRRYHQIMTRTEQAPARPAVELVEEQLEQFARRAIPAALDEAGNVLRPAILRCLTCPTTLRALERLNRPVNV